MDVCGRECGRDDVTGWAERGLAGEQALVDQADDFRDPRSGQFVFRGVGAVGPGDRRRGLAVEAGQTEGLTGRAERLAGVHQIVDQVDRRVRRQPFAGEPAVADRRDGSGKLIDDRGEVGRTAQNALEIGEAAADTFSRPVGRREPAAFYPDRTARNLTRYTVPTVLDKITRMPSRRVRRSAFD
jgi:hypothetical protein